VLGAFEPPTRELFESRLGISRAAAELYLDSDVVDLHLESFSFYRAIGYHPHRRHGLGLNRALVVGQADIPRLLEAGVSGACWVITGHPLRPPDTREDAFARLDADLRGLLTAADDRVAVVDSVAQYRQAQKRGQHAAFVGVQGAHALPPDPNVLGRLPGPLLRITLLHLTDTAWGSTSAPSPWRRERGLSPLAHDFIERMNELRIGVDLAHVHHEGFWAALGAADPTIPLFVTHTGVTGAHQHWRNLDDEQLRAIAERGGTVGIMYHSVFLGDPLFSGRLASVVRHVRHAVRVIGSEHVSLGSDWDGAICTPRDMPTCLELPRLVQALLDAGVGERDIRNVLGRSALRVIGDIKGE
jgi:membrane dipeptidase